MVGNCICTVDAEEREARPFGLTADSLAFRALLVPRERLREEFHSPLVAQRLDEECGNIGAPGDAFEHPIRGG